MTGHLTLRRHQHSLWDYNTRVDIRSEPFTLCWGSTGLCLARLSMRSHTRIVTFLLPVVLYLSLTPVCLAAALSGSCGVIYKSFAQCLLTLGDSLGDTQKEQSSQDIDAVCRSWDAFHVCANTALASCPGDAAAVWESLRQESRKTQFSGNLYDMCARRTTQASSAGPAPPSQSLPASDQTNQETLKGHTDPVGPTHTMPLLSASVGLLLLLRT
ncbi:neuritin 1-like b [Esox lucius]|uniref:Neuritin 1-like b n=1 Tax=Esox lucius TaxID=8010 RepID=A0A6Q2XYP3_ESOLU|nr:neuritin 1-like b [Esox lucius]